MGNHVKSLLFYHLLQCDEIVQSVTRTSLKLRHLVISIFQLSQAYIETDTDGRQRLYFWEPPADFNGQSEAKQRRIMDWLYNEFIR